MRRWLTRLLVLVLAPVVVVYGAQVNASAENTYGPAATTTWDHIGWKGTSGWRCSGTFYWKTTAPGDTAIGTDIRGDLVCKTSGTQDDTYVTNLTFNGGSCSWVDTFNINIDEEDQRSYAALAAGPNYFNPAGVCMPVTQACITVESPPWFGDGHGPQEYCEQIALGAPPPPSGPVETNACPYGKSLRPDVSIAPEFTGVTAQGGTAQQPYTKKLMQLVYKIKFTVQAGDVGTLPTGPGGTYRFRPYALFDKTDAGANLTTMPSTHSNLMQFGVKIGGAMGTTDAFTYGKSLYGYSGIITTTLPAVVTIVAAVGVTYYDDEPMPPQTFRIVGAGTGWGDETSATSAFFAQSSTTVQAMPEGWSTRYLGMRDSGRCVSYTGARLVTLANTTADDAPYGIEDPDPYVPPPTAPPTYPPPNPGGDDVDEPPPDQGDEDACGDFSLWNPTTWAAGGICVLVAAVMELLGMIGDLIEAVLGLAAAIVEGIVNALLAIVEAILDGLMALFVPDADALSGHIDGLQSMFDDSPAGGWTDAVEGGISGSPSGGCQGPAFDLPSIGGVDAPNLEPFNACGANGSAAGIVRNVLAVMVGLGGGFLILRMILTSLGIRTASPMGKGAES